MSTASYGRDAAASSGATAPTSGVAGRVPELGAGVERPHQRAAQQDLLAARWSRGSGGERHVAAVLDGLGPQVHALHQRLLTPARPLADLDHVVVTDSGVFVLETKNWMADLTVHHGMLWRHVGPAHSRHHTPQDHTLSVVADHAETMAGALRVPVHPVLVLANDVHQGFEPQEVAGVHVVPSGRLREWFLRRPVVVDDATVQALARACATRFPPVPTGPGAVGRAGRPFVSVPVGPLDRVPAGARRNPVPPSARPRAMRRRATGARGWGRLLGGVVLAAAVTTHAQAIGTWMGSGLAELVASR
ncbi:nuclease-related domain-containing protein [Lapillicoccus jejuensis]|uniref:Nuclease-like protein n=1 Tax=Lapillicoccus jejuensis TaxID=402171 RepID=A0A542DV48_9MICO|nr:nuclease-related domain-containing protein [Lapillicoccus jejuensis]TQJ06971.1 nuclease-like protein [Lapillicoccus jejuensis]